MKMNLLDAVSLDKLVMSYDGIDAGVTQKHAYKRCDLLSTKVLKYSENAVGLMDTNTGKKSVINIIYFPDFNDMDTSNKCRASINPDKQPIKNRMVSNKTMRISPCALHMIIRATSKI